MDTIVDLRREIAPNDPLEATVLDQAVEEITWSQQHFEAATLDAYLVADIAAKVRLKRLIETLRRELRRVGESRTGVVGIPLITSQMRKFVAQLTAREWSEATKELAESISLLANARYLRVLPKGHSEGSGDVLLNVNTGDVVVRPRSRTRSPASEAGGIDGSGLSEDERAGTNEAEVECANEIDYDLLRDVEPRPFRRYQSMDLPKAVPDLPDQPGTSAHRTAPDQATKDPPRSAYALVRCDDVLLVGKEFPLTVGLSRKADPSIAGDKKLTRPPLSQGPYTLSIQVVANGFALRSGERWRNEVSVTAEHPYPELVLHLTPDATPVSIQPRTIQAMFDVEGQTIGVAYRPVAVMHTADLAEAAKNQVHTRVPPVTVPVPTGETAADLTVRIRYDPSASGGRLLWTFTSPHTDLTLPDPPLTVDVGDAPQQFAQQIINQVAVHEGGVGLYQLLIGLGRTIADRIPDAFWVALRGAQERASGRRTTLLILSEEPYIPWELAVMDPPLDNLVSPFLAVQTVVGRWVIGHRRPKLPPPSELRAKTMAVVWGVYSNVPGWNRLKEAEAEAAEIVDKWRAVQVTATKSEVMGYLKDTSQANVLHFAVHGTYNPDSTQNGLVLVDQNTLDPLEVKGLDLSQSPFVFLNACQVGTGSRMLGDYAGLASAFLYAGASAVIAPLWSVKDTVAREIALEFYQQVHAGAQPADVFRETRAKFTDSAGAAATYLAYQFFGHPAMRLVFE